MTDAREALERDRIADRRDEAAAARDARADELERRLLGADLVVRRPVPAPPDPVEGVDPRDARDARADERDAAADRREAELRWLAFEQGLGREADELLERPEERARRSVAAHRRRLAAEARAASPPAIGTHQAGGEGVDDVNVLDALGVVVRTARRVIRGCAEASYTVVVDGEYETLVCTNPCVLALDRAQYATEQGPCIDALASLEPVRSDDLAVDLRWPRLMAAQSEGALRSVVSVPVVRGGDPARAIGSLNCYGVGTAPFDEGDAGTAALLAQLLGALGGDGAAVRRR